ncbi:hypothetical protein [Stratiformator vulcanicus]|uniref:Uncharacterized protein n=1 Tax=Stratiformator vulcanicus TaxID=2527980 RepID=A0A517R5Q5_9PLAN|nr:hypothetical protein [Stratiformator vulcanicus]QDT39165.1 hypothetical protein Pan189_35680 [Stratiformator vulcanicus]
MRILKDLWSDDAGVLLSAEAVVLGTVGVVGATVGLNMMANSINAELKETAFAIRSLDQSYHVEGHATSTAWTAASGYTQPPVEKSLRELRRYEKKAEREAQKKAKGDRRPKDVKLKEASVPADPDSGFYVE